MLPLSNFNFLNIGISYSSGSDLKILLQSIKVNSVRLCQGEGAIDRLGRIMDFLTHHKTLFKKDKLV